MLAEAVEPRTNNVLARPWISGHAANKLLNTTRGRVRHAATASGVQTRQLPGSPVEYARDEILALAAVFAAPPRPGAFIVPTTSLVRPRPPSAS